MEQDEAYRRIWQTFRTYTRVADGRHDTADWRSHDGVFAVCCIRVDPSRLQPHLAELQDALRTVPFARVHPDHSLHITLQELGFVCDRPGRRDEISPARLEEFANLAGAIGEMAPFEIALGGVNSFQDAVFLDIQDKGRCARLHTRLRELAAVTSVPRFAYLPHTTVAHYTADAPAGRLPALLARWRDLRFGGFRATQVEIVTIRLDEAYPPLEPYVTIPLTG